MAEAHLKSPELSVVVPVHNEAENILPLVGEIRDALEGLIHHEIVYVDDGSTDETRARLLEAEGQFDRLRIIRHRCCAGQSTAIRTGVKGALASWIVTLDGDGQNDPADIPRMISLLRKEGGSPLCLICGYRLRRRDSFIKRMSSRTANAVRAFLLRDDTPDTGCGLKLFSRDTFLDLPFFDHMHRFLPALFRREGGKVISVEVNHRPRRRGRSHYGIGNRLWVGLVDLFGVLWLQRRAQHPDIVEEKLEG
jgi:dolichol-phosphate mannosyltransferase